MRSSWATVRSLLILPVVNVNFFLGDGKMIHSARYDQKFSLAHNGFAVAELHLEPAFDDEEELVLVVVVMPDEFAFQFNGLDVAIVYLTDDPGVPVVGEEAELFFKIYGLHRDT